MNRTWGIFLALAGFLATIGLGQPVDDAQFGPEGDEMENIVPAGTDTTATVPDELPLTATDAVAPGDTSPVPRKSPGKAVLLSALIPGGGQVYTGQWWKALLIAPAEVTLGYLAYREHLEVGKWDEREEELSRRKHELEYRSEDVVDIELGRARKAHEDHIDRRATFLYWTGAVIAFSMADAWVSAQMYGFDRQMRFPGTESRLRLSVGPARAGIEMGI